MGQCENPDICRCFVKIIIKNSSQRSYHNRKLTDYAVLTGICVLWLEASSYNMIFNELVTSDLRSRISSLGLLIYAHIWTSPLFIRGWDLLPTSSYCQHHLLGKWPCVWSALREASLPFLFTGKGDPETQQVQQAWIAACESSWRFKGHRVLQNAKVHTVPRLPWLDWTPLWPFCHPSLKV